MIFFIWYKMVWQHKSDHWSYSTTSQLLIFIQSKKKIKFCMENKIFWLHSVWLFSFKYKIVLNFWANKMKVHNFDNLKRYIGGGKGKCNWKVSQNAKVWPPTTIKIVFLPRFDHVHRIYRTRPYRRHSWLERLKALFGHTMYNFHLHHLRKTYFSSADFVDF